MSSLTCIIVMVAVPAVEAEEHHAPRGRYGGDDRSAERITTGELVSAWLPCGMLVLFVLVWGEPRSSRRSTLIGDMLSRLAADRAWNRPWPNA